MVARRLGDQRMSKSEKQKRYRDAKTKREALKEQALDRIIAATTLQEAQQIAREARGKTECAG